MRIAINGIKKIIILLINCGIFLLTFLIPKSDKIVIVGGWFGNRFADNSKHFFLNLNASKEDMGFNKIVWITRSDEILNDLVSSGFDAYSVKSIMGIWYHFRAKYHVIDQTLSDINPFLSVRARRINLWHGFPLKNIGIFMTSNNKRKPKYKSLNWYFDKFSTKGLWFDYYLLATSDYSAKIIGEAFEINEERIVISGYPRNYETINNNPIKHTPYNEKSSYEEIKEYIEDGYKIIGYFPTFRDKRETLIFGTESIEEINRFLDYCESVKIKFVSKFHFAGKNDKFGDIENHKAFINLPSEADVYTFLDQIDILMTDYSSIYFDFLLWNRPILFFPYDLEYYRDEDRGLIFDYEKFTPGPKAYSIEELQTFFSQNIDVINEKYEAEYRQKADLLKTKIFGDYNNMGVEHLINQIRNIGLEEEK